MHLIAEAGFTLSVFLVIKKKKKKTEKKERKKNVLT